MFIALCQRNRRNLWSVSAPHLLQNCQSRFIYGDDNLSFGGMQNVLCLLVFFKRVKTWKWGTISSSWCESLSDLNTHKHWPNWSLFIRTKFQHTTIFSMTMCVTVALNCSITLQSDAYLENNIWLWTIIAVMMKTYLGLMTILLNRKQAPSLMRSKRYNTDGNVRTARRAKLKN